MTYPTTYNTTKNKLLHNSTDILERSYRRDPIHSKATIISFYQSLRSALLCGILIAIVIILTSKLSIIISGQTFDRKFTINARQSSNVSSNNGQIITAEGSFSFTRNGSHLLVDAGREWPPNSKREISFRFKTKSPHGLLLYQTSFDTNIKLQQQLQHQQGLAALNNRILEQDILMDLPDGNQQNGNSHLYYSYPPYELYLKLENGRLKMTYELENKFNQTLCGRGLNDDRWHRVDLRVDPESNQMLLILDQLITVEIVLSSAGHPDEQETNGKKSGSSLVEPSTQSMMESHLYLGGVDNKTSALRGTRKRVHPAQFIGCLGQIYIKNDLSSETNFSPAKIEKSYRVMRGCVNRCDTENYCLHGASCVNLYTHAECDCFGTEYQDRYCWNNQLTSLTMLGHSVLSYRIYDWRDRFHSSNTRLSLQFKTLAPDSILFFAFGDLNLQQNLRPTLIQTNAASSLVGASSVNSQTNSILMQQQLQNSTLISPTNPSLLGPVTAANRNSVATTFSNYLAISLSNGSLIVELNFGDQTIVLSEFLKPTSTLYSRTNTEFLWQPPKRSSSSGAALYLADGQWHNLTFHHSFRQISLQIDNHLANYSIQAKNYQFYFDPAVYFGGIPNLLYNETRILSWPINLKNKFVGCLKSVYFNQQDILLSLSRNSLLIEYRDPTSRPILNSCHLLDPWYLPITLKSGRSYLTFQFNGRPSSTSSVVDTTSSITKNRLESATTLLDQQTKQQQQIGSPDFQLGAGTLDSPIGSVIKIEFEYKTSQKSHFLAGGHLRDLSYHDLGGFWTLHANEDCMLFFTISLGLTFEPEQAIGLESGGVDCDSKSWFHIGISMISGDKTLNITRSKLGPAQPMQDPSKLIDSYSERKVWQRSYNLKSSLELLHQVQIGGDLAKFGESSSVPFAGCVRNININGRRYDSREFVSQPQISGSSENLIIPVPSVSEGLATWVSHGQVTLDSCRMVNSCGYLNPCKNNASCKLNDLGDPECECSRTGYIGKRCQFSIYKQSCQELFLSGQRKSAYYLIDLDRNGPLRPIRVRCNMDRGFDHIETVLSHNLPSDFFVRSDARSDKSFNITYLAFQHLISSDGFYLHREGVNQPNNLHQDQQLMLRTLIQQSEFCKQSIKIECKSSPLELGKRSWFISEYPQRHPIVSLDGSNLPRCMCASSEKRCIEANRTCNCDANESIWVEDSYELSSKYEVGLTQLVQLRVSSEDELKQRESTATRFTLGDLRCFGLERLVNQYEITFKTSDAYIEVPGWRKGDLSFSFRTASSPPAIILYQLATSRNHGYFRLSLISDQKLQFEFVVNRRPRKLIVSSTHKLNNGEWQQVHIEYDAWNLRLTVNDDTTMLDLEPNDYLGTFEGPLFIGGAPARYLIGDYSKRNGFTGCFRGLIIGGQSIDLRSYLSPQMPSVTSGCRPSCSKNLCQNGARCIEYWGNYECECSNPIAHSGVNCEININTNSITFMSPQTYFMQSSDETHLVAPYLMKSILLNIRTYQESALIFYATDQFNFVQLHKNRSSLVLTYNWNNTIVTIQVPIEDNQRQSDQAASSLISELPLTQPAQIFNNNPILSSIQLTLIGNQQQNNTTMTNGNPMNMNPMNINQTIAMRQATSSQSTNSSSLAAVIVAGLSSSNQQSTLNQMPTSPVIPTIQERLSTIKVGNMSGNGLPIQIKIERTRTRTTLYVNNNSGTSDKAINLVSNQHQTIGQLQNSHQFQFNSQDSELVRRIRAKASLKYHSYVFLGNVDEYHSSRLPGFTGCIQGFSIDNQLFDFNRAHLIGDFRGDYKIGCKMHCDSFPCKNQGTCVENWKEDKIQCKCDSTSYRGPLCDQDVAALFNSQTSQLVYNISSKLSSQQQSVLYNSDPSKPQTPQDSSSIPNSNATSASAGTAADWNQLLGVSFAFSTDQSPIQNISSNSIQVLLLLKRFSTYFLLGLTNDGSLVLQEDYGASLGK